jgi:ABC-type lipopolysaccharide export system ATPase subunit
LPQDSQSTAASDHALLVTDRLQKAYRKRRVVNGVSIQVGPGEIVGLLGPTAQEKQPRSTWSWAS